jgi:hypothetical protein
MKSVKLERPGGITVYVNANLVAAIEPLADRKERCIVYAGGASLRVVGSVATVFEKLGWPAVAEGPASKLTTVPFASSDDLPGL